MPPAPLSRPAASFLPAQRKLSGLVRVVTFPAASVARMRNSAGRRFSRARRLRRLALGRSLSDTICPVLIVRSVCRANVRAARRLPWELRRPISVASSLTTGSLALRRNVSPLVRRVRRPWSALDRSRRNGGVLSGCAAGGVPPDAGGAPGVPDAPSAGDVPPEVGGVPPEAGGVPTAAGRAGIAAGWDCPVMWK